MNDEFNIPDFSGDDLADDKEVKKRRVLEKLYEEMVSSSLAYICSNLEVREAEGADPDSFFMYKKLDAFHVKSLSSDDPVIPFYVYLARYSSYVSSGRHTYSGTEDYLFGQFKMNVKFPKTYITKETIREKIEDLFYKRDIDFEHSRKFSGRFNVLTGDKERLKQIFRTKDLDQLTPFPDLELEIHSASCLFRCSKKPISLDEAQRFCELSKILLKLLY